MLSARPGCFFVPLHRGKTSGFHPARTRQNGLKCDGNSHSGSQFSHIQPDFFPFALPDFSQTVCLLFILPRYNKGIETNRSSDSGQERSYADESFALIVTSKMLNSTRHFTLQFLHAAYPPPLNLIPSLYDISARK